MSIIPIKGLAYANGTRDHERIQDAKSPLIPWKEFQRRLPTENEIKEWFRKWLEANIAIVTEKIFGIIVADFDSE